MSEARDNKTVGLTVETHRLLQRLKEQEVFNEMSDGYRMGIALAIHEGMIAPEDISTGTFLNVGSLDPDGHIRNVVTELYPESSGRPYDYAERLAEAGLAKIGKLHQAGQLRFGELMDLEAQ